MTRKKKDPNGENNGLERRRGTEYQGLPRFVYYKEAFPHFTKWVDWLHVSDCRVSFVVSSSL